MDPLLSNIYIYNSIKTCFGGKNAREKVEGVLLAFDEKSYLIKGSVCINNYNF